MGLLVVFLICLVTNSLLAVRWWERDQWFYFVIAVIGVTFSLAGMAKHVLTGG